ncbi:hypothetical protein [Pseudoalteromonas luteoviolacea]|uniref:hypothetical protein n=1 Tax=Pseudoalteromonas luteoviolacea TaxID=43657 RepID=UPI001B367834|nr:hypothetical protein [Pseudoalteromonas luteoviolacea]MBQ4837684.1 hypothetical protein [Pseudoalteromonas luteoviolacea]
MMINFIMSKKVCSASQRFSSLKLELCTQIHGGGPWQPVDPSSAKISTDLLSPKKPKQEKKGN